LDDCPSTPAITLAAVAQRQFEGSGFVNLPRDAMLLRVFIGEEARFHNRPLYQAIVIKAREVHLAGATVLRGPMGFGHSTRLHSTKILDVAEHLPMVIEIVDTEEKIKAFLPVLDSMMPSGLVTLEKVQVLQYGEHIKHAPG
jgi:PII-like signaling protein